MTASLAKAFAKASRLPDAVQDQLAEQVVNDIGGELKWNQTLANSQDLLQELAAKARSAKQQGKATKKGFDEL
jgi:hypothetical protein